MEPSPYQAAIYTFIESGAGNAIVEAVAGSGKTTTLVEAIRRIPAGKTSIFLAFNRSIADELARRGVNARTFHSLPYSVVLRARGARSVTIDKLHQLIDENLSEQDCEIYGAFVAKLVSLGRQQGIGCLIADTAEAWYDIIEHHGLELDHAAGSLERAVDIATKLLQASNADGRVDFDDILYFAVKDGLTLPRFDFILVDEAQDTNAIQRAILRKILHNDSRLIAVGDPAQAIYGFRGADSDSLDLIAQEFQCQRFPLSISYRCAGKIVEYARKWVQHIEAAPEAPEGAVTALGEKYKPEDFKPGELVVCRTTAPLISLAFSLLKARIPARVLGRDIGEGLKSLVKRFNAKGIDALIEKLTVYTNREVEKAVAKKQDAKVEAIQDKSDCIFFLIDTLPETGRTVPALLAVIDELFSNIANAVKLSTIHKAKGLEAERVYWLNSSKCPAQWARQEWQQQQERNLCYVATTRAKKELVLIEENRKGGVKG